MSEISTFLGTITKIDNKKYRVLHIEGDLVILCELETTKLSLSYYSFSELCYKYDNFKITIEGTDNIIIDFDKLNDKEKIEFEKRKEIIDKIVNEYGPSFMGLVGRQKKSLISELQKEVPKNTLWLWIRKFLQSGLNYNSLVDKRFHIKEHKEYQYTKKTGRPTKYNTAEGVVLTKEVLKHFNEGLEYLKSGRYKTIKWAYNTMIDKYYSYKPNTEDYGTIPYPASEKPTYNQFYYYCRKYLTNYERQLIKTSAMEVNNNNRILTGSSRTIAYRPGVICECDACEIDVSIVSKLDPTQCIGRPIMYLMIDNCTSMIVAMSIGFENNSFIGVTDLMLNLITDKVEYANKYGVTIQPNMWRSEILPDCIRCDRGSEFASDKFGKVCDNLQIRRDLVPPGTGSMKGIVEEFFHEFQVSLRPYLENKGLITKRHDSKHHKEAMLTKDEFTTLAINYVITHNQNALTNYPITKEMLEEKDFKPIPVYLWDYFCDKTNEPRYITNANRLQCLYHILIEKTAKISKRGIKLSNLVYINDEDADLITAMFEAGSNNKKFVVRCDPRDVSQIYYMKNEQIHIAYLNPNLPNTRGYIGMSWSDYREYNHKRKDIIAEGKKHNLEQSFLLHKANNHIINNINGEAYANDKDINKNRAKEKKLTNYENRVGVAIDNELNKQISNNNKSQIASKQNNNKKTANKAKQDNKKEDATNDSNIKKQLDEFEPMEDLRAALEQHETKGRD